MDLIRKGILVEPALNLWWSQQYAICPTPVLINESSVRIFYGTADKENRSRITSVDVDFNKDEIEIVGSPKQYIAEIGEQDQFDSRGIVPSSFLQVGHKKYLYYFGYNFSKKYPLEILSGLLIQEDGKWYKYQDKPILKAISGEESIRSTPFVIREDGIFKMWYTSAYKWEKIKAGKFFLGRVMPHYGIKYLESIDGLNWKGKGQWVLETQSSEEFGLTRPWVYKEQKIYKMWYSIRNINKPYTIGYAESVDGIQWERKDDKFQLEHSKSKWDSEMTCYASLQKIKNKKILFYNGNGMGKTGFGIIEIEKSL